MIRDGLVGFCRTINEKDIPVLFVHGSGGSAFQVSL